VESPCKKDPFPEDQPWTSRNQMLQGKGLYYLLIAKTHIFAHKWVSVNQQATKSLFLEYVIS
jgi:hypothetical protein